MRCRKFVDSLFRDLQQHPIGFVLPSTWSYKGTNPILEVHTSMPKFGWIVVFDIALTGDDISDFEGC